MTTHIIALGGSLLRPEEAEQRTQWFGQLRQLAVHLEGNGRRLGIVVGGGLPAREGITLARQSFSEPYRLDTVGIAATRLNATILQQSLLDTGCNVCPIIPNSTEEAADLLTEHNFVIMGGTSPGHTTDAVAVALARDCGAPHCVIATNVTHVHDSDPRLNDDAKPIEEMTLTELARITGTEPLEPGESAAVDPVAVKWAIEANVKLAVLDGRNLSLLEDAIEGRPFVGTLVRTE
ncbi:MAG: UMP kinase [Euryarchaeota archaeon]|nr:UMP kinase [Euryarchaeota archaeon]MBT4981705.1 UMP kinase [Euryarchaeota archaeon]MBT5184404.1 UMP kinase [Euryarchaeota archaeon]